ncbi:MAG TPA: DegT/DnrJ/EryC1/StrS aminotransferase family protein [Trueperaceae bacterium]|jgi:dTDP-4-amino-4,6-dideoxygalactose transaminase
MTSAAKPLVRPFEPWPRYTDEEVAAVAEVLRSGRVNQWTGEQVFAFEREYAEALGRKHAIALMNGTVALELALRAGGVGEGDDVVTTPRTFIASAGAAVVVGARPVLADVDRDSGNITAETIERALTPRTKAIVVVHLAGWPADMPAILDLARDRGLLVVEDCAQAHGAAIDGQPVGSFGDMAAFSFCQDKIITTGGEGGLLALDREDWFDWAWSYKDHGKGYHTVFHKVHPPGYQWLHDRFGTNWRMTEMQAALGRIQLGRLEASVAARARNAARWRERLGHLAGLRLPEPREGVRHAYYRLYGYVVPEALKAGWDRDRIQEELAAAGLFLKVGSCSEIYREEAFVSAGLAPAEPLPVAREIGETVLGFPVHPTLSEESIDAAAGLVAEVVARATR